MSKKVSLKYASSFLDLAIEKGNLDATSKDVDLIISVFKSYEQLKRICENPIIKTKDKIEILQKIFEQYISKETFNFINFLGLKGRENFIFEIFSLFNEMKNERLGIAQVELISALELSETQIVQIKDKLEKILNKKITLDFKIDSSLIGGFLAVAGDTIIDGSLKHQLDLLKKQLVFGGAKLN